MFLSEVGGLNSSVTPPFRFSGFPTKIRPLPKTGALKPVVGSLGTFSHFVIRGNLPRYIGGLVFGKPSLLYCTSRFHLPQPCLKPSLNRM